MCVSLFGHLQGDGLMVRVKRRGGPVDYRLCSQTVTLYHWDGREAVTRRVIAKGAFPVSYTHLTLPTTPYV